MDQHTKDAKDFEEASRLSVGLFPFPFIYTSTSPQSDQNRHLGKPRCKYLPLCPPTSVFPQTLIALTA